LSAVKIKKAKEKVAENKTKEEEIE